MPIGEGRAASPQVIEVSELTHGDVVTLKPIRVPALQKMHDSHHMLARLCAMGLGTNEVASRSGYAVSRVSVLRNDPIFKELIATYKTMVDAQFVEAVDEYYELANAARTKSMRMLNDKLDRIEDLDDISIRELVSVHSDTADRTGYPKRSVAVNVNVDFAARLDRAITASNKAKVINPSPPVADLPADGVREGGTSGEDPPSSLKRRVA